MRLGSEAVDRSGDQETGNDVAHLEQTGLD